MILAGLTKEATEQRKREAAQDAQCLEGLTHHLTHKKADQDKRSLKQLAHAASQPNTLTSAKHALTSMLLLAKWDPASFKIPKALLLTDQAQVTAMDLPSTHWHHSEPTWLVGESTAAAGQPPRRMHLNALSDLYTHLRLMSLSHLRAVRSIMPVQHRIRHVQEVITFLNGRVEALLQAEQTAHIAAAGVAMESSEEAAAAGAAAEGL